jgi:thiamine-monophosphate kinase
MKISEYDLLQKIEDLFGKGSGEVIVGIGDDAAVVRSLSSSAILTTDSIVEGVHFGRSYFDSFSIGFKAVGAAISDVAAMAGVPKYCLLSVLVPSGLEADYLLEICEGAKNSSGEYGAEIVGGNLSRTDGPLAITICVLGFCDDGRAVTRSGAGAGDSILVTGDIGSSQAGRLVLEEGPAGKSSEERLCKRHLRPRARVEEALKLRDEIALTSMIDISDGLAIDLGRLCRSSLKGARVTESSLPILDDTYGVFERMRMDPVLSSISGGEDFELLFTVGKSEEDAARDVLAEMGVSVNVVGAMTASDDGIHLQRKDGSMVELAGLGFDHFL